jgi:Myb-like DNA-binding domain
MKRRSDDSKKSRAVWTAEEDEALLKAVKEDKEDREAEGDGEDDEDWDEIAKFIPDKTPVHCLKRYMALSSKGKASQPKASPTMESEPDEDSKPQAREPAESTTFKSDSEGQIQHDEDEEGEEETGEKPNKRARGEGEDAGPIWLQEETDLLKKLVEQYEESECSQDDLESNTISMRASYISFF